ncbi:MAG: hypothetical protein Q8R96_14455 [Bacteroidota bacterium]|nr:hypothetical protein [Bacteroidota bacterium]
MWILTKFWKPLVVWILAILLLTLLVNNRHHKTGTFNWMTPLWADQAGYYVYLPSLFIYNFDPKTFPEDIEKKTGLGFSLDLEKDKVVTRYTCGIAILQAPFFIFIHILAGILNQPQDGFSGIYHQVPNLAAVFYCILGIFFLWKFLLFYYKQSVVIFTIVALFFGTNLYYYAVDSTGMSHIYSFALFAIVAWLSKMRLSDEYRNSSFYSIAWSLIFALIVLIRPTNILIFPFLFCLDCKSIDEFWLRVKRFFTSRDIAIMIVSFLLVFLPQFLYWKYATGRYIADSYEGYGFTNWKSPKILELWFSPNNGLFLYSPFYIAAIWGMILMIKHKKFNGWLILSTFVIITYVFASWFVFSFGCSYGSRNYVEYTALFALPLGYLFTQIINYSKLKRIAIIAVLTFLVLFNLKLVYSYNRCFQGDVWDFQEYTAFFVNIQKYHQSLDMEGFEHMTPENEFSKTLYLPSNKIYFLEFKKAIVRTEVILEAKDSEAALVLAIETPDSTLYWSAVRLKDHIEDSKLHKKQTVEGEFWIPVSLPKNATIATYIWNLKKESLTVNELELTIE